MRRSIAGFNRDAEGDWVADLSCLHGQHVRHRPPFSVRSWVLTASGRDDRQGTDIECPLCDRAEPPDGLVVTRVAGPFDSTTLPAALRTSHVVAASTWGCLRVLEGAVGFVMATDPPLNVQVAAGNQQAIPPGVPHRLVLLEGPVLVAVDFLTRL